MKTLLEMACNTNYDGDRFSLDVKVPGTGTVWALDIVEFKKVLDNLACLPSGNACDMPSAQLLVGEDHRWKVLVSPASFFVGEDASSVEFTLREFSRIPEEVITNFHTINNVRE